jgi:uncharacterized protein
MKKVFLTLFTSLLFAQFVSAQFEIPEVPKKQTSFYDYIGLLNKSGARFLEEKLIQYSDSTTIQIVIIIIESTKGENINKLAKDWGNKWGIGQKEKDNGIVLLMAKGDRKVAISTGKGIEKRLTNAIAKRVIESRITPEFKKGKYYKGLNRGVDAIIECLSGDFEKTKEEPKVGDYNDDSWWQGKVFERIFAFLFFAIIIISFVIGKPRNGRRKDDNENENDDDYWDSDTDDDWGIGFDDFDGGGSSGSLGGGFGGGSFGGGGASGSW